MKLSVSNIKKLIKEISNIEIIGNIRGIFKVGKHNLFLDIDAYVYEEVILNECYFLDGNKVIPCENDTDFEVALQGVQFKRPQTESGSYALDMLRKAMLS